METGNADLLTGGLDADVLILERADLTCWLSFADFCSPYLCERVIFRFFFYLSAYFIYLYLFSPFSFLFALYIWTFSSLDVWLSHWLDLLALVCLIHVYFCWALFVSALHIWSVSFVFLLYFFALSVNLLIFSPLVLIPSLPSSFFTLLIFPYLPFSPLTLLSSSPQAPPHLPLLTVSSL